MSTIRYCLFLLGLAMLFGFASAQTPVAAFSGMPRTGQAPLAVTFVDQSIGSPTGWAWYFGDENWTLPIWTPVNVSAGWTGRFGHSSVVIPDGSIVLMGGYDGSFRNDVWRSTDNGTTWTQMNASAGWTGRRYQSSVAMPDGSIVLMGGGLNAPQFWNDVWRSTDNGTTWTQMNASAGWIARGAHSSVVMPDGSIVLMGGLGSDGNWKNDVWRSTNNGTTWIQVNASAGWTAREFPSSVVIPDGSIVLMGGWDSSWKNDVWRSTDNGTTWTQMNASAGWTARYGICSVAMPDSSIVLMSGASNGGAKNDVWRSTDNGTTWIQVNASAGWTARQISSSVVMPDSSIVLMGGDDGSYKNDVWRLMTAGSSAQNPSHTYTLPGIYQVTQQVRNAVGYNSTRKIGYVIVIPTVQAETGVYRPGIGFYLKMDNGSTWNPSTDVYLAWDNAAGDLPIAGDWNADGRSETGVYRHGVGFYLKMDNSSNWTPPTDKYLAWDNAADDLPIAGKFV
jgi:hypothetical protein